MEIPVRSAGERRTSLLFLGIAAAGIIVAVAALAVLMNT